MTFISLFPLLKSESDEEITKTMQEINKLDLTLEQITQVVEEYKQFKIELQIANAEPMSIMIGQSEQNIKKFMQLSLDLTTSLFQAGSVECLHFFSLYNQCLDGNKQANQLLKLQLWNVVLPLTNQNNEDQITQIAEELCQVHPKLMAQFAKESVGAKPLETIMQFYRFLPHIAPHIELKEKELEQVVRGLVSYFTHQSKELQLIVLGALDMLCDQDSQADLMGNLQNLVLTALLKLAKSEEIEVKSGVATALNGFLGCVEELKPTFQKQLIEFVQTCFSDENMQLPAALVLRELADHFSTKEAEKLFGEFMPTIQKLLERILIEECDPDEIDSVLICFEEAVKHVPKADVKNAISIVVKMIEKHSAQEERLNFASICQCYLTVGEAHKADAEIYSAQVKQVVEKILKESVEDDEKTDSLKIYQQLIQYYPHHFDVYKTQQLINDTNVEDMNAKQECLIELMGTKVGYEQLKDELYKNISETFAKFESLNEIEDCADAFASFAIQMLKHDPTSPKLTQIIEKAQELTVQSQKLFKQQQKECKNDEYEMEQIYEDFENAIDAIGSIYEEVFGGFKEMPLTIAQTIFKQVNQLYRQAKTPENTIMTEKCIELCGSLCQHRSEHAEVVKDLLKQLPIMLPHVADQHSLVHMIYYALTQYLKATNDVEIAQIPEFLTGGVQILDECLTNKDDKAKWCFDNICAFLIVSGKISKQTDAYWTPMISYCKMMSVDVEEIMHCVEFFSVEKLNVDVSELLTKLVLGSGFMYLQEKQKLTQFKSLMAPQHMNDEMKARFAEM